MKDFQYYSDPKIGYFGHDAAQNLRKEKEHLVNETPMTAEERKTALAAIPAEIRAVAKERNAPYNAKVNELLVEFWKDARDELGYTKRLNEIGCQLLESEAWERGHASGFESVYGELERLAEFAETVLRNQIFRGSNGNEVQYTV